MSTQFLPEADAIERIVAAACKEIMQGDPMSSPAQRRYEVLEIARLILSLQAQLTKAHASVAKLQTRLTQKQEELETMLSASPTKISKTKSVPVAARTARAPSDKALPPKGTKLVEVPITIAERILAFLRADPDTMHYPFEIARKLKMERTIVNATLQAMYKAKDVDRSNSKYYAVRKPAAGKVGKK